LCCIIIAVVYIPPDSVKSAAEEQVAEVIMELETAKPDAGVVILGDFNGASLDRVLPKYKQYVTCNTRNDKCLDLCYSNLPCAYVSKQRAPLGCSDHNMVRLMPAYVSKLKAEKPVTKSVQIWDKDSLEVLGGSLACTDWSMFKEVCSDLDELTETVSAYIQFCTDTLIPQKKVRIYPNNKPWVTKELRAVTRKKHTVIKSGDKGALKEVQKELSSMVDQCKAAYKRKVEEQFSQGKARACWQGLKHITGHGKGKASMPQGSEAEVANSLNNFYARFNKPDDDCSGPVNKPAFKCEEDEVRRVLSSVQVNKAAGPDSINPAVIKHLASDLAPVCTTLYNLSLEQVKVPTLWKMSTIIPVPKKAKPVTNNDYRPVALTSIIMKCFERLVLVRLLQQTKEQLDPLQFAYKSKRGTEDAIAVLTHRILQHLDTLGNYVRILFVDFSSAFNTMRPSTLHKKLQQMGVDESLCAWINNYLRERPQRVRVGSTLSDTTVTNIGAPQGCVLSPVLFIIYTNDHRGREPHSFNNKYADDAALVGLITNKDESEYRASITEFAERCHSDDLDLNVTKTKEIIIDFRKVQDPPLEPVVINDSKVEIVTKYDYLGTRISNDLTWCANTEKQVAKASRALYGLRKLREFKVSKHIMRLFYCSTVESVLYFGISVWGGSLRKREKKSLNRVRRCASRIIGESLDHWEVIYSRRASVLARKIMADTTHPLNTCFAALPSGRRLRQATCRTNRLRDSFVPNVISVLNR